MSATQLLPAHAAPTRMSAYRLLPFRLPQLLKTLMMRGYILDVLLNKELPIRRSHIEIATLNTSVLRKNDE